VSFSIVLESKVIMYDFKMTVKKV